MPYSPARARTSTLLVCSRRARVARSSNPSRLTRPTCSYVPPAYFSCSTSRPTPQRARRLDWNGGGSHEVRARLRRMRPMPTARFQSLYRRARGPPPYMLGTLVLGRRVDIASESFPSSAPSTLWSPSRMRTRRRPSARSPACTAAMPDRPSPGVQRPCSRAPPRQAARCDELDAPPSSIPSASPPRSSPNATTGRDDRDR
jgi:hypothetical protein